MRSFISQRAQLIRSYSTGIGKSFVIYPAAFIVAVAGIQLSLGLVFYARDVFAASPAQIGWLGALWSLCYVLGCLLVRPLFSACLPRYLVLGATFCATCASLAMQFAPSVECLFVLCACLGFSISLFWPPIMGWLSTDNEGAELGRVVNRFNLAWSLGTIIGPFMCGLLSQTNVRLPLLVSSALYLLATVFVAGAAFALPLVRADTNVGVSQKAATGSGGRGTPLRFPAWIGLLPAFFAVGVMISVFPISGRDDLGLSKSTIGLLLLGRSLTNTALFVLLGRTVFWHFRLWPMLLAQGLGVVVFAGMARTDNVGHIAALLALLGVSSSLSYAVSIFHGASGSSNRATRMALHEAFLAIGLSVGPVVGGLVYQNFGISRVYWLCALLLALSIPLQLLTCLLSRPAKASEREPPGRR